MNSDKGAALERAVAAIESTILERNPELRGHKISIESRKTILVRGVKHEIDVFVTIPRGDGYDAIFIFECKNRKERVGKNDIVVFSEKIDVTSATRGFFVATGFGEYARAQAEQNPRLVLMEASENLLSTGAFENLYLEANMDPNLRYTLRERNTLEIVKPNDATITIFRGKQNTFGTFMRGIVEGLVADRLKKPDVKKLKPGNYTMWTEGNMPFSTGMLLVDGRDIEAMTFKLSFGFKRIRPKIISGFEINGRGRYIEFEDIELGRGHSLADIRVVVLAQKNEEGRG